MAPGNGGREACTGEYVAFLDADDRLLSNALTAGVRAFAAGPDRALVWGARSIIDSVGHQVRCVPKGVERAASYAELLETNIIGPPVGVLFRRTVVAELGGFSSQARYAEDYDLYLRIARGHAIYHHAELVAEYRLHSANMSGNVRQMHKHLRRILERQRSAIAGDARLGSALRRGLEDASDRYQWEPRVDEFRDHRYAGRWLRATLAGAGLLVRYPRRFPALLARRVMRSLSPNDG